MKFKPKHIGLIIGASLMFFFFLVVNQCGEKNEIMVGNVVGTSHTNTNPFEFAVKTNTNEVFVCEYYFIEGKMPNYALRENIKEKLHPANTLILHGHFNKENIFIVKKLEIATQ